MKHRLNHRGVRQLSAREELRASDLQVLWRIEFGALRVDSVNDDNSLTLVRLAVAGDLLGVEAAAGVSDTLSVRALTPVKLVPVSAHTDKQFTELLLETLAKVHERCRDMVSLRAGAVEERVRKFLNLLSIDDVCQGGMGANALPTLSHIADVVNSTPETVCRVLTGLRRQQQALVTHSAHAESETSLHHDQVNRSELSVTC